MLALVGELATLARVKIGGHFQFDGNVGGHLLQKVTYYT